MTLRDAVSAVRRDLHVPYLPRRTQRYRNGDRLSRRGGEKNRTRSSPTGPAEQEEGGSLRTQSQYQLIQIIVVCGGDMFEGQCPSTPRNSEQDKDRQDGEFLTGPGQ